MNTHHHPYGQHAPECQALLTQLGDHIDGELETALCAEIERHLANCDDRRVLVDTTRKTVLLYRQHSQQSQVELPKDITSRLWQALAEEGRVTSSD